MSVLLNTTEPQPPRISAIAAELGKLKLSLATRTGIRYQVYSAEEVSGTWQPLGEPFVATGTAHSFETVIQAESRGRYYRVVETP